MLSNPHIIFNNRNTEKMHNRMIACSVISVCKFCQPFLYRFNILEDMKMVVFFIINKYLRKRDLIKLISKIPKLWDLILQ